MRREDVLLAQAAGALASDLARTLGGGWHCEVTDDDHLRVTDGHLFDVRAEIEVEVDLEDALPSGPQSQWRDQELADDATDAVAEALQWAVEQAIGEWPLCPTPPGQVGDVFRELGLRQGQTRSGLGRRTARTQRQLRM
jgi:hypothetical protein